MFDNFVKQEVSFKLTILVDKIIIMALLTSISFHSFLIKFLALSKFVPHKSLYTNLSVCISLSKPVLHSVGHPFILFPNTLLCPIGWSMFMIKFLNIWNRCPCIGLVKESAIILFDKQCDKVITPLSNKSFTKKYRISKCLVRFPDDSLPFLIRSIVLRLSSIISVCRSNPCSAIKLLAHCTVGKMSSTAISLVSVELLVFTSCLQDLNKIEHCHVVRTAPLCLLISIWEAYEPSIYQLNLSILSHTRVNVISKLPFR
jgi:hypothetical protein